MTSPDDAILILKGWESLKKSLVVSASLFGVAVDGKVRVTKTEGILELTSVDDATVISIPLTDVSFLYAEAREFAEFDALDSERFRSMLGIALPLRVRLDQPDVLPSTTEKITLFELLA